MKQKLDCIMLIEDNHLINIFNKKLMEKMDITNHIQVAENALVGLEYLNKKGIYENQSEYMQPNIIFLDLNMPRMSGWEFIEEFKKIKNNSEKEIKIVILTSSPNPDDLKKAESIPEITAFEKKPLTKEAIHNILQKHFPTFKI